MNRPVTLFPLQNFECYFDYDDVQGHLVGYIWLDREQFPIANSVGIPIYSVTCNNMDAEIQRTAERAQAELALALSRVINVFQFTPDTNELGGKFVGVVRADVDQGAVIGRTAPVELICKDSRNTQEQAKDDAVACQQALVHFWGKAFAKH